MAFTIICRRSISWRFSLRYGHPLMEDMEDEIYFRRSAENQNHVSICSFPGRKFSVIIGDIWELDKDIMQPNIHIRLSTPQNKKNFGTQIMYLIFSLFFLDKDWQSRFEKWFGSKADLFVNVWLSLSSVEDQLAEDFLFAMTIFGRW